MKLMKLCALIEELIEQDELTYLDIVKIVNQIVKDEGITK